jgi:hypothetical protein
MFGAGDERVERERPVLESGSVESESLRGGAGDRDAEGFAAGVLFGTANRSGPVRP